MKDIGENEKTRIVEISDPAAKNLDEAFLKMWEVAGCTKCKKPLHHISINPMKGERLTDKQVLAIADRCEEVYGYKMFHHQRVIVEHIKDDRQHFHVVWNRVSLMTGRTVWPGHHWKKSKQVAREMEERLGLKRPEPRQGKKPSAPKANGTRTKKQTKRTAAPATRSATVKTTSTQPKGKGIKQNPVPTRPAAQKKDWPEQAIMDWKVWGHLFPRRFFIKWPELANT
ncbi:MAG: relaxase/mobilization nuclease domain-containing protein [Alphaproteobacteria bacterium]|nr:relaxase/mobilization nuclease domain-containing protein [Alphaproteobacteria bacterium]